MSAELQHILKVVFNISTVPYTCQKLILISAQPLMSSHVINWSWLRKFHLFYLFIFFTDSPQLEPVWTENHLGLHSMHQVSTGVWKSNEMCAAAPQKQALKNKWRLLFHLEVFYPLERVISTFTKWLIARRWDTRQLGELYHFMIG